MYLITNLFVSLGRQKHLRTSNMLKLALIIMVIVAFCVALLTINIWLRGGEFRSQHIGQSEAMRSKGIHCVQSMDKIERKTHKELLTKTMRQKVTNNKQ